MKKTIMVAALSCVTTMGQSFAVPPQEPIQDDYAPTRETREVLEERFKAVELTKKRRRGEEKAVGHFLSLQRIVIGADSDDDLLPEDPNQWQRDLMTHRLPVLAQDLQARGLDWRDPRWNHLGL